MLECVYLYLLSCVLAKWKNAPLQKYNTSAGPTTFTNNPWESGKTRLGKLSPPDQSRRVAFLPYAVRHAMVADPEYHWSLPAERGGF